jgi:hypothetical protein
MTENEHIKLGAYHTLELEQGRAFVVAKDAFDALDVERIRQVGVCLLVFHPWAARAPPWGGFRGACRGRGRRAPHPSPQPNPRQPSTPLAFPPGVRPQAVR